MSDVPSPPEPHLAPQDGESLLSAISREMVRAMKTFYGRGPTKAKSYLVDDLLFVVMRGGATHAEQTMLEGGEEDAVRAFRQRFENLMAERLVGTIEQLTDRRVLTYQSQVLFDPLLVVEIFVFDKPLSQEILSETSRVMLSEDESFAVGGDGPPAGSE